MSTLQQVREGLHQALAPIAEGWQKLYQKAAGAMTRFSPAKGRDKTEDQGANDLVKRSTGWAMLSAEVFDDNENVIVRLEAPGLEKDDIDIDVVDNYLIIRGEKKVEQERSEGIYHVTECAYGLYERAIPLPEEVDPAKAKAQYKRGVLKVELPKKQSAQRKRISVSID